MSAEASLLSDNAYGLISALIGGSLALAGVFYTQKDQAKRASKDEEAQVEAVLQAIDVELTVLLARYQEAIGKELVDNPPGEAFWCTFPVYNDYFTVYHTNAGLIGRIPDQQLRLAIVTAYSAVKGLLDTYTYNNKLLERHAEAVSLCIQLQHTEGKEQAKTFRDGIEDQLQDYSATLLEYHNDAVAAIGGVHDEFLRVCSSNSA